MTFNVGKAIKDKGLWVEFDRLGISGESTQEVILSKNPEPNHHAIDQPLHEVVLVDRDYVIIRKNFTNIDPIGSVHRNFTYYISGINDEGKYFIRPLKGFPMEKYQGEQKPSVKDIVDWMNRIEEGFNERVQGDVLAKFVYFKLKDERNTHRGFGEYTVDDLDELTYPPTSQSNGSFGGFSPPFIAPQTKFPQTQFPITPKRRSRNQRARHSLMDGLLSAVARNSSGENVITVEGINYSEITDKPLKLGNHKLFTEGKIFASKEMPFICVVAQSLILQHHEHQVKELKIPINHVVILAAQRGRDFDLKDLNYLKQSYD